MRRLGDHAKAGSGGHTCAIGRCAPRGRGRLRRGWRRSMTRRKHAAVCAALRDRLLDPSPPEGLCVLAERWSERRQRRSLARISVSKAKIDHKGASDTVYAVIAVGKQPRHPSPPFHRSTCSPPSPASLIRGARTVAASLSPPSSPSPSLSCSPRLQLPGRSATRAGSICWWWIAPRCGRGASCK